jgi:hypothetical protein
MPVGSEPLASGKRKAIVEGAKRAGFEAKFPDYLPSKPAFRLPELVAEMQAADSIIADLSRERPSCYYELGIAEVIGKKVHIVAEAGTPIHQSAVRSHVKYYTDVNDLVTVVENALKPEEYPSATLI